MGVTGLWALLQEAPERSAVRRLSAADRQLGAICASVEGLLVALDVSTLVVQALLQPALAEAGFSDEGAVRKLMFERCVGCLRFGVTLVGVTDGRPPQEKHDRLVQRNGGKPLHARWRNAPLQRLSGHAADVMRALGLACLQAPGEAEAFAAALNAEGLVDAVLSPDGDALTFGARTLFRSLTLSRAAIGSCELERVDERDVRAAFGLQEGGTELLTALAMLSGCDYAVDGAERVGPRGVLRACVLLQRAVSGGGATDAGLLERLRAALDAPPDATLAALRGCTGCRRCKHDGGQASRRAKHLGDGCVACGTRCAAGGGPLGAGGCVAAPEGARCGCAWHVREEERHLARVLARANATPGFRARFDAGVAAFRAERAAAARAAAALPGGRGALTWRARPDEPRLRSLMRTLGAAGGAGWDAPTLLRKLLPALLAWDLAHPGSHGVCFELGGVKQRSGDGAAHTGGAGDAAGGADAYVVTWRAAAGLPAGGAAAEQAAAGVALTEAKGSIKLRTVLATALRAHAPAALAAHDVAAAAKATAAAAATARAERRLAAARSQPRITAVLRAVRPAAGPDAKPVPSSGGASGGGGVICLGGDDSDEEAAGGAGGDAADVAAAYDSDSDPLPPSALRAPVVAPPPVPRAAARPAPASPPAQAGATQASAKRESPSKPAGGSAKKTRPSGARPPAAATPAQTRDLRAFFAPSSLASPLASPPPAAAAAAAADAPRKQLRFAPRGAEDATEAIDLLTPSPPPRPAAAAAAAAHECIDLTADDP